MIKTSSILEIISSGNAPYCDFGSRFEQANTITTLWLTVCYVWFHSAITALVDWFEIDWVMTSFVARNAVLDKPSTKLREVRISSIRWCYYSGRKIWSTADSKWFIILHKHVCWTDGDRWLAWLHIHIIAGNQVAAQYMNELWLFVL